MEYIYPAVFTIDEEEPKYINVRFPNIMGAFTFGEGMDDALFMAEDLLRLYITEIPKQCFPPSSLEEVRKEYPDAYDIRLISVIVDD